MKKASSNMTKAERERWDALGSVLTDDERKTLESIAGKVTKRERSLLLELLEGGKTGWEWFDKLEEDFSSFESAQRKKGAHGPKTPTAAVAMILKLHSEGKKHQEIATALNVAKFKPTRAEKWTRELVKAFLQKHQKANGTN